MDKFFIITNKVKDEKFEFTYEVINYIEKKGGKCAMQSPDVSLKNTKYQYTNAELIPSDTECAIVLGGDGTLIQAARDLHDMNIPLLGINIGTLGFLTDIEKEDTFKAIDALFEDRYFIDERMMLEGNAYNIAEEHIYSNVALNDIVINRNGALRVIDFKIYVNEEFFNSYTADGVIISTPTGSTAYNLSAGGPIVEPGAKLIVITPVCPHSLNKSSIILGANDKIVIEMCDNKGVEEERVASFDGELHCNLVSGDRVEIKMAKVHTQLVRTQQRSILQTISKKMING